MRSGVGRVVRGHRFLTQFLGTEPIIAGFRGVSKELGPPASWRAWDCAVVWARAMIGEAIDPSRRGAVGFALVDWLCALSGMVFR
jgi:hypothetical protein